MVAFRRMSRSVSWGRQCKLGWGPAAGVSRYWPALTPWKESFCISRSPNPSGHDNSVIIRLSLHATAALLGLTCLLGAGCNGKIGEAGGSEGTGPTAGMPGTDPSDPAHTSDGPLVQPTAHLHKLTASAFANSVHDLLGSDAPLSAVEQDSESDGFYSVGASMVSISPAGVAQYEGALGSATDYVFADANKAAKVLSCIPQTTADTACATKALGAFGRRAFRRPLDDAESARFVGLAKSIGDEAGSVLVGLRYAVWAILQSPSFLYRVELGAPSATDGGRLKYTSYEMSSRLAATLWNTAPDDVLLDAANNDGLASADTVRAQAVRMLKTTQAHQAMSAFFEDLYGTDRLQTVFKDATIFPAWSTTLRDDMIEELRQRLDDMVFSTKGDFLSLYDGKSTFVNNELARYYGLPEAATDGFRPVQFPDGSPRLGLLGSGALLSAYALPQRTSPTQRGKFVATMLLCKTVPPPPPGVNVNLDSTSDPNAPLRDRLTSHRQSAACAACHGLMDPIGLGLENFDSVGMYRDTDHGHPIDASGDLDGAKFQNAAELGARLHQHDQAGSCFVRKLYTNAQGRSPVNADDAQLAGLAQQFAAAGNHADALLVDLMASDAFRFVEPAQPAGNP